MSNKGLGRGLGALFQVDVTTEEDHVHEAEITDLRPNPYQPRKHFDDELLQELTESIKQHGIVQPLVVRKSIRGYEIVAGERRFRAAKAAGLTKVPVVVREFTDDQMMEIALVENLQREDLNPMEVAHAYQKLMKHLSVTQEELAERVGKSRPHVANFLRLLQLPPQVQDDVSRGTLSMGHARALLGVKDADLLIKLAEKVKKEKPSVRQLEEWVQQLNQTMPKKERKKSKEKLDPQIKHYEDLLQQVFSTPVRIKHGRKKGKIEIEYYSDRELERLIELLNQERVVGGR
ncbi:MULTISPECIES: ParB/RepB/Spo0J family partition protein [Thermoactinomyces]|jgi:ParB family transcriptional regulator, chromosome partitioning protein|uniref:ParB/RepB/Spo0J family partition protein n=1 Tax=Thermoactinomyces daqus TaxID=1329516 RepID=A0A7W1X8C0_9BACL|nr:MULTISPECIES: ParB/RepB/Spo0J family partition protein [Thermoactinomyces]MBA4541925.1 ParB/RepB/Spo0J family partition protein [Thermoactinomyces daqus]MBH8597924.1 ParB/RepB/Spo0J family partition protein [Thermoactinomyces sp. CICC 10523]MBH8604277.1 ParB/RepB/Spo0J family partition protein [Thermoactinomyces sp. CICC 10522]MBH8607732.1 ParB/RepB/Spo0J family partition protein [Thermoactinomyces sp. CICC 10521]